MTIRQLQARGITDLNPISGPLPGSVQGSPAEQTLRWFDLFMEFFLDHHPDEQDDILYFISSGGDPIHQHQMVEKEQKHPQGGLYYLFIKRRPAQGTLPSLSHLVRWEETFYVNLIAHLQCQVRICTVEEESVGVVDVVTDRIYAQPTRDGQTTYPMIYFALMAGEDRQVDLYARQTLCVELALYFGHDDNGSAYGNSNMHVGSQYAPWRKNFQMLPIFQGAVNFQSLRIVHRNKVGGWRLPGSRSQVIMRGPTGRGIAQVMIRESTHDGVRRDLVTRIISSAKRTGIPLRCCLSWVSLDWQQIMMAIHSHFSNYSQDEHS